MNIFIYGLFCPLQKKIRYVGKSRNPKQRYHEHKHKSHSHYYENTHLKNWWKKLDKAGLQPVLQILEEVKKENWRLREKFWIKHFGLNNLCNMNDGGLEPPSAKGRKMSDSTKEKLSKAKKGKPIWIGDKMHPMKGRVHPNKGTKRSQAFKNQCRALKLGKNNPNFGKKMPEQTKEAIRKANHRKVNRIDNDDKIIKRYDCIKDAREALHLYSGAITRVCNGELKQTHGYRFQYAE